MWQVQYEILTVSISAVGLGRRRRDRLIYFLLITAGEATLASTLRHTHTHARTLTLQAQKALLLFLIFHLF